MLEDKTVYFQPQGINPLYCEVGMLDNGWIYYLNEPCKIHISEVKIISPEDVIWRKNKKDCIVKSKLNKKQNHVRNKS